LAGEVGSDHGNSGIEDTGDSNNFPQGPYADNESDTPDHCDNGEWCKNAIQIPGGKKVGCPLGTFLTKDGVKYTREKIAQHILYGSAHQKGVGRLWNALYRNALDNTPLISLTGKRTVPTVIVDALSELVLAQPSARIVTETFTDLNFVYGITTSVDQTTLWRLEIDDYGKFGNLAVIGLPASEGQERTPEDLITEAISEGAWD
jgi:hypothetical protein